ncbi:MAG: CinA family protein [Cellvibrionaceae bacterium]
MINRHSLAVLAVEVGKRLSALAWTVTTAESCTGGGVAHAITAVSGSSKWFEQGFVTYSNRAKHEQLGVKTILIESSGAVSGAVAVAMADGALKKSGANVAVAITGIAGPDGGSSEKPVGTVWIAWSIRHGKTFSRLFHFDDGRKKIREKAVIAALEGLITLLDKNTV